jgi:hypothetical protein
LTVDRVARFQVLQGNRIIVDAYPGVQAKDVRVFLLGSAFGALFHQRGMFPLHGSAVKVHEQCVVFCGASGRGKSTTAKALVNRGYALHADDICPVSVAHLGNGGTPVGFPAYPQMKVWQDAWDKIGEGPSGYGRVRHVLDKYEVPAADRFNTQPLPLRRIYVLRPREQEGINISEITGRYKFTALKNQTYRFGFLEGLGQQVSHLNHAGIIGSRVPVFSVQRPRLQFRLDELIDALEADFVP